MNATERQPIPGLPGYFADADGLIWSTRSKGGGGPGSASLHLVARRLNDRGYYRVNVCIDNRRKTHSVHVLVLLAFVGLRPEGQWACHNNGVRTDCRPSNLRWDTPQGNSDDMKEHGTVLKGEQIWRTVLTAEKVKQIRGHRARGDLSLSQLAKKFGVTKSAICHVVAGRCWKECA